MCIHIRTGVMEIYRYMYLSVNWNFFYKVVSSNPVHGEVYSIQHYVIKFVSELRLLWNTRKAHASFKVDMWEVPSSKERYDSANPADMLWVMTRYLSSIWNKNYLGLVVWFPF